MRKLLVYTCRIDQWWCTKDGKKSDKTLTGNNSACLEVYFQPDFNSIPMLTYWGELKFR